MRSLDELLREGIDTGQFGGEIKPHGEHALGFVSFSDDPTATFRGHVVDIGSGVGLPALVLAEAFPETTWTLVERRAGRCELLARAVKRLGFADRVEVRSEDVTSTARSSLRESADWVTARSFGSPGDTAECAAALLVEGGELLTSEPIDGDLETRWPEAGLSRVDLSFVDDWRTDHGRFARFRRGGGAIPDVPRRGSRKRPLF